MAVTPNSIITPQTPRSNVANLTTANTTYTTTPTNSVLLVTAGPNGARLIRLAAIPAATVTANQIQMFRSLDGGTTKYFADSTLMAAYAMAQNTEAPTTDFGYSDENPLILSANERIYMAEGQSVSINILAEWVDY
ncbi:MAG: hypothetical protein EPO51_16580 [Phenylobacterium sp.]|uniref:hypothetical protein n=1 Tax=Phenylobacterium sp. TaxID=1871053 RepID=UPI001203D418|nr:hypothetical protein [Phenylobacterium sp.]TAJ70705.1 MAG: hypothetical protein EPO51_16580 [Phenylobacterium sp.]